jgi:tungstate transport system ATP-binding protein
MEAALFQVRDLVHRYGSREALSIPSLSLEERRIYALVGPNGSGKSTFLSILNRILQPTEGEVYLKGERIWPSKDEPLPLRRSMTLVMQNAYLFQGTVAANVAYGLTVRKTSRDAIRHRVASALDQVGLSGFAERRVRELSGGEAQRVALARALVLRPQVLLLDEAMVNLDEETVWVFEEIIRRVHREDGVSVIFSTHDRMQAERLAQEILILRKGRMFTSNELVWRRQA